MTFIEPHWLFLAIPLGVLLFLLPPPSLVQRILRGLGLVLIVLALAGLQISLPSRLGTIVIVADRSASMPAESEVEQQKMIDIIQRDMRGGDRLAVVSFGQGVSVERLPSAGRFGGFQRSVGRDASQLTEGIEKALELLPEGAPGRIFVLSDGRWTGRNPTPLGSRAAAREIAIDYRLLERTRADDVAIERVDAPASVSPGESFLITAWVQSPIAQEVTYKLHDRGRLVARGKQRLASGRDRIVFRDRAHEGGNQSYTLEVTGEGADPVPGNNLAKLLVGVEGPRPLLHVTRAKDSGLAALLKKGGLDVVPKLPAECVWNLEELSRYSAVLLENVPAGTSDDRPGIPHGGMEMIASWVKETGSGLMMTGGRESYGPGGYYKSPLDPILPVSMELKNEHRKLSVAIVVVLDRSGSMAMPVSGGQVKMDLANAGAVSVLELLGPSDEFGCIAVDTVPHTIVPLMNVTEKGGPGSKIKKIQSMGGGIFVYEALKAAATMIAPAKAGTKHIILFSDAQDSEEPGDYRNLIEKMNKAGITISVIGLGKKTDVDAKLLEDIASRGKGRCFFTDRAEELPRLFAQDTFVVARNTFLDEPVAVRETAGLSLLTGRRLGLDLTLGGYNLCYLKPEANLASLTLDEYRAPLVASWHHGTGRVLCYTGEADGKYAGQMPKWEHAGEFYTSLARWTAGQSSPLPDNMMLTQEVRNGVLTVRLHLDPERKKESFTSLPQANVVRAEPGQVPSAVRAPLRWTGPDTLAIEVPLQGTETAVAAIEVPGQKEPVKMPPVCLPYSPELRPVSPGDGESGGQILEKLARATGGRERVELGGMWAELPRRPRLIALAPWLLCVAILVILLEVFDRRTGLLSHPGWLSRSTAEDRYARGRQAKATRATIPATSPVTTPVQAPPEEPPSEPESAPEGGMFDALRRARERTRSRLE